MCVCCRWVCQGADSACWKGLGKVEWLEIVFQPYARAHWGGWSITCKDLEHLLLSTLMN